MSARSPLQAFFSLPLPVSASHKGRLDAIAITLPQVMAEYLPDRPGSMNMAMFRQDRRRNMMIGGSARKIGIISTRTTGATRSTGEDESGLSSYGER